MPELPQGFDPDKGDYGTFGPPDVMPAGNYKATIVESEKKENKKGTGFYIRLVIEILDGDHKGRKLFEILNLWHENPQTTRIAMAELTQLCNACGGDRPKGTEQLHGIPFMVKVGQRRREDTQEMQNSIRGFFKIGEEPKAAATAEGGADTKAPWKK